MMKRLFALFVFIYFCFNVSGFAQNISSHELIENAAGYDLKEVVYQGEAIGEALERNAYCWVNVHDGSAAIGLWMSQEDCKKIKLFGDYNTTGDMIKAKGIFHKSCKEHSGELDIHVSELEIIKSGLEREHVLNRKKMNVFLVLFSVLCLLWILQILKSAQRKKLLRQ